MLPGIGPEPVKQRIAYGIVRVREPIVRCQKILPAGSRVTVERLRLPCVTAQAGLSCRFAAIHLQGAVKNLLFFD